MEQLNINPRVANTYRNVSTKSPISQTNTGQILDVKPVEGGGIGVVAAAATSTLTDKINAKAADVLRGGSVDGDNTSIATVIISIIIFIVLSMLVYKLYLYWFPNGIFDKEKSTAKFQQKIADVSDDELRSLSKLVDVGNNNNRQQLPQPQEQTAQQQPSSAPSDTQQSTTDVQQTDKQNNTAELLHSPNSTDQDLVNVVETNLNKTQSLNNTTDQKEQQPGQPIITTPPIIPKKIYKFKKGDIVIYDREDENLTSPAGVYASVKDFLSKNAEADEAQVLIAIKNGTFYMNHKFIIAN
jgi:flagellar basal body-associated protein FliL